MKRLTSLLVFFVLLGMAQGVSAAAKEEVEQFIRQWAQTYNEGNLEGFVALFADDVQSFSAPRPFRSEGKGAVRASFAGIFEANPTRRLVPSHVLIRIYGDSTAVATGYMSLTLTDRKGETGTVYNRWSFALAKIGGKWLAVGHHVSRLPASP